MKLAYKSIQQRSLLPRGSRGRTHIETSVTVGLPWTEVARTELDSIESENVGEFTVDKVQKGRLDVIVRVTKLHNVELRTVVF